MTKLKLATRQSPLALWQAHHVTKLLTDLDPNIEVEIMSTETQGDRDQTSKISELGGKGVFASEVQRMVATGDADLAVHSAKDLPSVSPDGLTIAAFPRRGDARDALVGCKLANLPKGATVATGSPRRRVQLLVVRPDLQVAELRGNIGTRLQRASQFHAIVMAHVALIRLDEAPPVVDVLSSDIMVPQVGQGALAVECRSDDEATLGILAGLSHPETQLLVGAERRFLETLGGDCDLPAGAHAVTNGSGLVSITGVLANSAGEVFREKVTGPDRDAGSVLANRLRELAGE